MSTSDNQIDLADLPGVWRWLKDLARRDPEGFLFLSRGNVRAFEQHWGPAQWQPQPPSDWTAGWSFSEDGLSWIVLSGPRSTSYRIRLSGDDLRNDPKVTRAAIAFLERLMARLIPS